MKTKLLILAMYSITLALVFSSCKKGGDTQYVCTTCNSTPEGLAANDNLAKGIYKGIVIGSSGTIKFDVNNAGNTITATLTLDGQTATLISQVSVPPTGTYISPFYGTLNGQPVSVTFSVNFDGTSPTITTSNIPGHPNAVFVIAKETSTALVRCFEGTYSTTEPENGTFNIVVSTTLKGWKGKARETGASTTKDIEGSYVNNILYNGIGTTTPIATINGDTFSGSFFDGSYTVTVNGQRKN